MLASVRHIASASDSHLALTMVVAALAAEAEVPLEVVVVLGVQYLAEATDTSVAARGETGLEAPDIGAMMTTCTALTLTGDSRDMVMKAD